MLALALFIGARLAELPAPPPLVDDLPVHRFVAHGGLGEHVWLPLAVDEPAPTPSIRLVISARGQIVELEAHPSGHQVGPSGGAQMVGFARRDLGDLARLQGVLTVHAHALGAPAWRPKPVRFRSEAVPLAAASPVERMASLSPGASREAVRRLLGAPALTDGRFDWYDANRLVFDGADRFVRWDPMGC